MSGSLLISAKNIGVDYAIGHNIFRRKTHSALKDVSFELHAGDSLGVIGRNGAGKSSLLKVLAGIIEPDRGTLWRGNIKTALMALQVGFDNELSGLDNILLSGMLLGFSKAEVELRREAIISFAQLGEFIKHPVKTYSVGMRARLGFSICYELQPEIMLIDEVLGVGDVDFRKKSSAAMRQKLSSDQTVVLVSHNAKTINALCNKAIWIEDGVTRMFGEPAEVVAEYQQHMLSVTDNESR